MKNTTNEPTVKELKDSLDIKQVAEKYGTLIKTGANYKYENNSSIVINPVKQIYSDFNGNIKGGSVLDLVMQMENICIPPTQPSQEQLSKGIEILKELSNLDTYVYTPAVKEQRAKESKEKKTIDFQKIGLFAKNNIKAGLEFKGLFPVYNLKKNENEALSISHFIVRDGFIKLFETEKMPFEYFTKINYMTNHLLGYDSFYKCPSIIIKDDSGRVVDYIAYRPNKPDNFDKWSDPKYIYKNSHNRGENFLYPFRKEVESILSKQTEDKTLIVGEGIKNGLNALLYSIPFIPLESSSNKVSDKLITYIKEYHEKGFNIICMFDGDTAGKKAFDKFKEQIGLQVNNFLDFNSGLDFVDYLQSEDN
jgi:hypothetical protein